MNKRQVKKNIYIKKLLHRAKKYKLRIKFVNRSIYGWAHGSYDASAKTIEVCLRRPDGAFFGIADIAFVLAHEIRHAQHRHQGLFRRYYNQRKEGSERFFKTAWNAEKDCDKYAARFINRYLPNNNSRLRNRIYPAWRVHPNFLPRKIYKKRKLIDIIYSLKRAGSGNSVSFKKKDGTYVDFITRAEPSAVVKLLYVQGLNKQNNKTRSQGEAYDYVARLPKSRKKIRRDIP